LNVASALCAQVAKQVLRCRGSLQVGHVRLLGHQSGLESCPITDHVDTLRAGHAAMQVGLKQAAG
jgi:hypothetical protein